MPVTLFLFFRLDCTRRILYKEFRRSGTSSTTRSHRSFCIMEVELDSIFSSEVVPVLLIPMIANDK